MKKALFLLLSVLVLIMSLSVLVTAERYVTVVLDGETLEFDVQPRIINDRTMVPIRKIFESMGALVDWDNDTQTVIIDKGTRHIEAQIGNYEMYINDEVKPLDTAPVLLDGRTLVPVRFIAEALGALVEWDNPNYSAIITSPEKISLDSFAKVSYQYDLTPYLSITKDVYTGLEYSAFVPSVSTDELNEAVMELVSQYVEYINVSRACNVGDLVNIDYKGYINGKALENGADTDVELVLGQGTFIPGFEEGIVGRKAGESFDVEVTFPEDYGVEELNGVKAVFKMTLNSVREVKYPELDDSFIASVTKYKTLTEFVEAVSVDIVNTKLDEWKITQKNEVFAKLQEKSFVKSYPKAECEAYYNEFYTQYTSLAAQYGVPFDTFLAAYLQITAEEFEAYAKDYAESTVKMELVFFAIANAEGIIKKLNRADYIAYLDTISDEYQMGAGEFERMYGADAIVKSLIYDSVMDLVLESGKPV